MTDTIHLHVFAVCHTYKISQMSVQSQRASSPIRGTGNIDPWEHKRTRDTISLRLLKKHNEHGDSVCELLKHIFSYRNLSRVWTSIQTIPNSKWLPSWRRCHVPKFWRPLCFSLVYCSSSKIYGLIPMYLANWHPVLLLDPWTHEFIESTRRTIENPSWILTLVHIVRARRRLFHSLYIITIGSCLDEVTISIIQYCNDNIICVYIDIQYIW